ncbi:uncharacterized protein LOC114721231 [Neltuma alba]|uniref:uncharacterized protein LOC114721231 n=1 Tax=Neltuma alba TaxID=207710 RepID=UPI0010A50A18|nr:uncharacterized protein LOC114721231 [Prosopis alba]
MSFIITLKILLSEISTTQLQACPETTCSQAEEKADKNLSSHLNTEQSLNMGETTQQSLTEKVPVHASPNLTILPIRDNTHASAKIFEEEDEEEEEDSLITSRRPRNGKKVSSSLPEKKLENSTDGDPRVPPETTVSSEQTSTSLNQTPSSNIPKHSDGKFPCCLLILTLHSIIVVSNLPKLYIETTLSSKDRCCYKKYH